MRLDHLLSREPVNWGRALSFCGWVCVSCAYILTLPVVGGGCGCVFRVGHLNEASMLSGSRSTPVGR